MKIKITEKEKIFINAYFEGIDFTETGDMGQAEPGAKLDDDFERESIIDCLAFYSQIRCFLSDDHIVQAGIDFWFTRNGHGAGFWDKPEIYGESMADIFTKKAKYFGEAYPIFIYRYDTEINQIRDF